MNLRSFDQADAMRQTRATLAIENLYFTSDGTADLKKLVRGQMSREEYQRHLKESYRVIA